jgi:hypothetical protein
MFDGQTVRVRLRSQLLFGYVERRWGPTLPGGDLLLGAAAPAAG